MLIRFPRFLLISALLASGSLAQAQAQSQEQAQTPKPDLQLASRIPPGFESIIAGQTQLIELHLLGRKLGLYSGFVTPDSVTFSDPQDILAMLPLAPQLSGQDRAVLLERLRQPLKRNNQLSCSHQKLSSDGCGYLVSDALDIIYSEDEGRADLFLKTEWLSTQSSTDAALLSPTAGSQRALLQRQSINAATTSGYRSVAADAAAVMGVSDNSFIAADYRLLYNASEPGQLPQGVDSRSTVDLGDLYYRYDIERRYYTQFGRMSQRNLSEPSGGSFGFRSLPIGRMLGVRFGTTRAYQNNQGSSRRTPITVQLIRPARIDAYRGNQLLGTAYFNAGIHNMDTSSFPPGSYVVSLRIIEDGRLVRSEQLPFSRLDAGAGNPGEVQWFLQAGQREQLDAYSSRGTALLGGISSALTERTSVTLGLAHQQQNAYAELRLDHQFPAADGVLNTSVTLAGGSDGSWSNAQEIYWSGLFTASIYRNSARVPRSNSQATSGDGSLDSVGRNDTLTASLAKSFDAWTVSAAYTRLNSETSYAAQLLAESGFGSALEPAAAANTLPAQQWQQRSQSSGILLALNRAFKLGRVDVNSTLSLYQRRSDGRADHGAFVSFTFSQSAPSRNNRIDFDVSSSAGISMEKNATGTATRLSGTQSITRNGALHEEYGASVDVVSRESLDLSLYSRLQGKLGDVYANLSDHVDAATHRHTPSFSASYSSTIGVTDKGLLLGGDLGSSTHLAAILVSAKGGDEDSDQALARVRGYSGADYRLSAGDSILLPTVAFQAVTTEVSDPDARHAGGIASVKSGAGVRDWFVLPGHIGVHEVNAIVTYTYLGQLLVQGSADTEQLAGGTILDAVVPDINQDGSFVSDFHFKPSVLNVLKDRQLYQCQLPAVASGDGALRNVGSVACTPSRISSLPKPLLSDQRVLRLLNAQGLAIDLIALH